MALGQSASRRIVFKEEVTWGTLPASTGGQVVRRMQSTIRLTKDTYQSQEKRQDFQRADSRHGIRRVTGGINGELYCGSWEAFMAAVCRRDFTAVADIDASAGDGFTIVGGSAGATFTLARGAYSGESFLTDGLRVGMVFRLTGMNAANVDRNFLITAMASDGASLSFVALDRAAVTTEAVEDESATLSVPGKVTYIPTTGHTSKSYTVEDYDSGIDTSEIYTGCVLGAMNIQMPATGIATIDFPTVIGKDSDEESASNAPYFTAPTAAGIQRALAATPGYMRLAGGEIVVATGASVNVDLGIEGPAVAFAETIPVVAYSGMGANITGQLSAFVPDQSLRQKFKDETEVELNLILEAPGAAPRNFVNIFLGRVKINSADRDDPERLTTQTLNFESLLKEATTGYFETSLFIQDSTLS